MSTSDAPHTSIADLLPDPAADLIAAVTDPAFDDSPAFVIDLGALRSNLEKLADVQRRGDCRVLLALKGFATWGTFPIVGEYLSGVTSSSVFEARLGKEKLGKEVHAYAPAYTDRDVSELTTLADHVVLNSVTQWQAHGTRLQHAGISCGIRVNPEHSEVDVPLYDPCAPASRLGITAGELDGALEGQTLADAGLEGLHFHTLCELGSDALERTVAAVEERFARHLKGLKWINFGGGHHITRPDYDVERLLRLIAGVKARHGVDVYLEPGEAVGLGAGVLVASVLDLPRNGRQLAILDASATAHMPDVLEMPYRPKLIGAGAPGEAPHTYRLGGLTCLAGDVIGDYSFPEPLTLGSRLVFTDMAHYTMVKTTMFNGVRHPAIATFDRQLPPGQRLQVLRRFGYEDYAGRLG